MEQHIKQGRVEWGTVQEGKGSGGDEKHQSSMQYLAFVSLLSQSEANKELTPLRVQRHLSTFHQSHWHNRGPQLTLPQCLRQTQALRRTSRLQEGLRRGETSDIRKCIILIWFFYILSHNTSSKRENNQNTNLCSKKKWDSTLKLSPTLQIDTFWKSVFWTSDRHSIMSLYPFSGEKRMKMMFHFTERLNKACSSCSAERHLPYITGNHILR